MKKLLIITLTISLLLPKYSFALGEGLNVGISTLYSPIASDLTGFKYVDDLEPIKNPKGSYGLSIGYCEVAKEILGFKDISFCGSTNRLIAQKTESAIIFNDGTAAELKSKMIVDSFSIGKVWGMLVPHVSIANLESRNDVYINGGLASKNTNYVIAYAAGISFFLTKHIDLSIDYVLPLKELGNTKGSVFVGLLYIF